MGAAGSMDAQTQLNAGIAAARSLIADGQHDRAADVLAGLRADPLLCAVLPHTALGLPRRLQAALLHLAKARGDRVARAGYQFHLVPVPNVLAPLFRFTHAQVRDMTEANRQPVPQLIHQVWIGDLPVPQAPAAWQRHAAAQGYTYRLWREADLAAMQITKEPAFEAMRAQGDLPGMVDVARYAILARDGGIYLDCDWYPARDDSGFHDLLPLTGMTAMAEDTPRLTGQGGLLLANSFIATPAGHPAMRHLLQVLPQALAALPKAPAWWVTGPLVFTLAARGGAVSVAPSALVAGNLPRGAPYAQVAALRDNAADGLLIAWKSW